jgi:hypothetical protein
MVQSDPLATLGLGITNRRGMVAWNYCCPAVASIRDSTCSNGAVETRKSPRNGLLRAIIRISTRTPEAASKADIASFIRRLGAPRNEPKATVRATPTITTNQTMSGIVVCAASSLSCLAQAAISLAGRMKSEHYLLQSVEVDRVLIEAHECSLSAPAQGRACTEGIRRRPRRMRLRLWLTGFHPRSVVHVPATAQPAQASDFGQHCETPATASSDRGRSDVAIKLTRIKIVQSKAPA